MSRYIDADGIQYTMLYKENWITNTGVEKQGVWKDDIDKIPTADVRENVKGEWVQHDCGGFNSIDKDTCSVCKETFYQIAETGCIWNYCPNCGADMRGDI